jgi:hypothetical protein
MSHHSLIYSILMFLGKMHPSLKSSKEEEEKAYDLSVFVPIVQKCGQHSMYKLREMAAKALIPLIISSEVLSFVEKLLINTDSLIYRQNTLHGILLQIMTLLNSILRRSGMFSYRKTFLCRTVPIVISCNWMGSKANPCPLTRRVYLDLVYKWVIKADFRTVESHVEHRFSKFYI